MDLYAILWPIMAEQVASPELLNIIVAAAAGAVTVVCLIVLVRWVERMVHHG